MTSTGEGPRELARRIESLANDGWAALQALSDDELLRAWSGAIRTLRDASSPARRELDPQLLERTRLSPAGLVTALDVVLGGADVETARRLFARARPCRGPGVTLVILASNLPGLAVQTLLPALARRRPLVLKSSTAEPHFATLLRRLLVDDLPQIADGLLCTTWPGGARAIEDALFPLFDRIVIYGNTASIDDVEARVPGRVLGLGAKISLGVVSRECDATSVAPGLARDIALFDQRGCLSLQAIVTDGDGPALAAAVARSLQRAAEALPPGRPTPGEAAGVHCLRLEAEMRGLEMQTLALAAGTVVVETGEELAPSPGLRSVRIYSIADLGRVPEMLAERRSVLQGVALAGAAAWALRPALAELGVTRFAPPGELQHAAADWCNGGIDPLVLVAPQEPAESVGNGAPSRP